MTRSQNNPEGRLEGFARRMGRQTLIPLAVAIAAATVGVATASATTGGHDTAPEPEPVSKESASPRSPTPSDSPNSSAFRDDRGDPKERWTERRTVRFLDAFQQKDIATVAGMLHPHATLVQPFALSGKREDAARFEGRDQVLAYFHGVFDTFTRVRFDDERISVVAGGDRSFVEANGDLVLPDGRPYENVYVFGLEWRDGRIVAIDEYANTVTFCQTIGGPECATPGTDGQ